MKILLHKLSQNKVLLISFLALTVPGRDLTLPITDGIY